MASLPIASRLLVRSLLFAVRRLIAAYPIHAHRPGKMRQAQRNFQKVAEVSQAEASQIRIHVHRSACLIEVSWCGEWTMFCYGNLTSVFKKAISSCALRFDLTVKSCMRMMRLERIICFMRNQSPMRPGFYGNPMARRPWGRSAGGRCAAGNRVAGGGLANWGCVGVWEIGASAQF